MRFLLAYVILAVSLSSCASLPAPPQLPSTMIAARASGIPCDRPNFSCVTKQTVPVPTPTSTQVLLRMGGASVNPVNIDMIQPVCRAFGHCTNGTIGNDGAGTVVQLGADCPDFAIGDVVWGFPFGAYAEYAVADCSHVGKKPATLNVVDAGTMPVVGGTALQCLKAAGMPSQLTNLTVVVTAGQGGTGFIGVQLAKALGATRVVTAATGKGIELMKMLGADVVVDYHKHKLSDVLQQDSVDIVFDNLGVPGTADDLMPSIRSGGTFLVLEGGKGGKISTHPKAGVRQVAFGLSTAAKPEMDQLAQLFDENKLVAHTMDPTYGLGQVSDAFTRLLSSGVLGKIAIVP